MDRQEILRREYEACRQDITDTMSRYWTIVSIFIPVDTVLLGGAGFIVKSGSSTIGLETKLLITLLGLGIIAILVFLWCWGNRMNFYIRVGWHRIREIETELGMLKNRTIHWLDNPEETPSSEKARIDPMRKKYSPGSKEMWSVEGIFCTIGILWALFIVVTWALPV